MRRAMIGRVSSSDDATHRVVVYPLPRWPEMTRLLGPGAWKWEESQGGLTATARVSRSEAADLQARLRGLGLAGRPLAVEVDPALPRAAVREARTVDARRRRETTPLSENTELALSDTARLGWTPIVLARGMGAEAAGRRVVDACCGAGGNAIGFALEGCEVVGIDTDLSVLELARTNAARHGVAERIELVAGDARDRLGSIDADLLFIDPPWGADWNRQRTVASDLDPLLELLDHADRFADVWLKLPSSLDPESLPGDWQVTPVFGEGAGDQRRIKFVWLRRAN